MLAEENRQMNSSHAESARVQVFVASENRLIRESLGRVLGRRNSVNVIGSAPLSAQVWELASGFEAEVVLVDGQDSRAETTVEECAHRAKMKVLVMGIEDDENLVLRILRAGAAGVMLHDADVGELVTSIHLVAAGEAVCPRKLIARIFHHISNQHELGPYLEIRPGLALTRRERQLLPMMARGFTNKEIADDLHVSEQTIKNHIHHILRKTGAKSRLSAVEQCRCDAPDI